MHAHAHSCGHSWLHRTILHEATGGDCGGGGHPLTCRVSPTSVTASMEAPVFSSSSMTRIWFFLQAMCKGVKPFCSPAQRETDKRALTHQTALLSERQPLPRPVSNFPQTRASTASRCRGRWRSLSAPGTLLSVLSINLFWKRNHILGCTKRACCLKFPEGEIYTKECVCEANHVPSSQRRMLRFSETDFCASALP